MGIEKGQPPDGGCGLKSKGKGSAHPPEVVDLVFYLLINVEKILYASVECQLTPTSIFVIVKLHIWESS